MAKKKYKASLEDQENELEDVLGELDLGVETKKAIESAVVGGAEEKEKAIEIVNKDNNLTSVQREKLHKILLSKFVETFSFENCPDNYEALKSEVRFLSQMAENSFIFLGQRLIKVRDEDYWKLELDGKGEQKYARFEDWILEELPIKKRTAYNYINIIDLYGVQTFALEFSNRPIEYTKLLPSVSILKSSKVDRKQKYKIKNQFINYVKNDLSVREIEAKAENLKIKYELKRKVEDPIEAQVIKYISNKRKKLNKEKIDSIIIYLNKLRESI